MSHFTCLVIGPDHEGQLAPYDENLSVEPYKGYWDSDEISRWEGILQERTTTRRNRETGEDDVIEYATGEYVGKDPSLEEVVAAYNARYRSEFDEGEQVFMDEGGAYEWSTYNPKSRWDWYAVGGRWRGHFKLKQHALASAGDYDPSDWYGEPRYDADQALKGDVDLDGMRDEAGQRAAEVWDLVHKEISDLPEALGWETHYVGLIKLHEAGEEDGMSIEEARESYHHQPRVIAIQKLNESLPEGEKILGWMGADIEHFQVSREEFVQEARDEALCPYAYVMDGEWHAPGKMGWFGMSSDTRADRVRFAREFNELLDSLPDDTELTLVDCHI